MKHIKILVLILSICGFNSCNKNKVKDEGYIPALKIEVPKSLKQNNGLEDYIYSVEDRINTSSNNIEQIILHDNTSLVKEDSSSVFGVLEHTKHMINFYATDAELKNTILEFEQFINDEFECGNINAEQHKELEIIDMDFKHRVEVLEYKYEEYYK